MNFPRQAELSADEVDALVTEHPAIAHVGMTVDGIICEWGATAAALFGWSADQALGRRMIELTVPPELHAALQANDEAHATLEPTLRSRRFEVDHVDRDGRRFLAEVHCYPVHDGETTMLHAFLTDAGAGETTGSERRRHAIVDSCADAVIAFDGEQLITDWNPAAERLLGWPRPAIVGVSMDAVVPPPLRAESRATWQAATESDGYVRIDTQRMRRDGTLIDVEVTLTRLDGLDARSVCSAACRDISERRRREREWEFADGEPTATSEPHVGIDAEHERALAEQILELAREHLSMDVTWLAELTEDEQLFHVVVGEAASFGLREGQAVPRAETICARVVAGTTGPVHGDAQADPELERLARIQEMGLGAYIGVPVRLRDGRTFGTLCAIDHRVRPDLSEHDANLMRLLAGILAGQIDRRREEAIDERSRAEVTALSALLAALEARDQYTGEHSGAVVQLALTVAAALGASDDEIETVSHVATLHDLGKVGIPDAILRKPGPLTEGEWALMREHPAIGARIVAALAPLAHLAPAIRAEHERWDGGGYPDGLSGEQIPLAARITLACDAYHAMVSDRPYRPALGRDAAIDELRENAGAQFDPAVVKALVRALDGE